MSRSFFSSSLWTRFASGSSTFTLCAISGAVMMKMMSSTSITSTRGVTLMSFIGPLLLPVLKAMGLSECYWDDASATGSADARAGGEEVVQIVGERVELGDRGAVDLAEEVEGEHRRDGDEQTDGGHDQRLAHRAGHGIDGSRTGGADADQGAVDAPHRTQQTHERGGRTDGRQQHHARLQLGALAGDGLAQGAVHELRAAQALTQATGLGTLVVGGRLGGVQGDLRERLAARLLFHDADGVLGVRGFPEGADHAVGGRL